MRRLALALFLPLILLFTGCASAPMATPERDQQAKTFAPVAERGVIYIFRDESFGAAVKLPLVVDGRLLGDTVAHSYFRLELEPGTHEILSKAEADSTLKLTVEAGKVYFVWQEVKMGLWSARCLLHEIPSADEGRKRVGECTLLEGPSTLPK
jgi:hypothetical protein